MKIHAILIVACIFALSAPMAAGQPLAEHLPAETLAYIGWAGTQSLPFDGSMFGQLLKEPAVGEIMATILAAARKGIEDDQDMKLLEHGVALGGTVWRRPFAVAWLDLQTVKNQPIPSVALLIDLGDEKGRKAFNEHLAPLVQALEDEVELTDSIIGTVTFRKGCIDENGPEVALGYLENVFFLTIGNGAPAKLIGLDPDKSLKTNKNFVAKMAQVSGDNEQTAFYVDITAARKLIEPLVEPLLAKETDVKLTRIIELLGLDKATAVAGATRIVDKGMYIRTRLYTPQPHRGVLLPYAGGPLASEALAGVPADADFVWAAKVSPIAIYTEIRRLVKAFDTDADLQVEAALMGAEGMLGIKLVQDILGNMGDTLVLSSAPSQGGFLTGTVLTLDIKNPKAFGEAIAKIQTFCQAMLDRPSNGPSVTITTIKANRTEIHYVGLPIAPIPVAPAWSLHKNKLYISLWPQVIETTLAHSANAKLVDDPTFKKFRARVSPKASSISYTNTPGIIRQVYGLPLLGWTTIANAGSAEAGITLKPSWLPALSRLEKYIWPDITAVSTDAEGITTEQYGSLPFVGSIAGASTANVTTSLILPYLFGGHDSVDLKVLHNVSETQDEDF